MTTENLLIFAKNFYYSHTYTALAIVAALLLFLWFNPKDALKIYGGIIVFALIVYGFSILGRTTSGGMHNEKRMINQTVDRAK